jgi:ADP-ribose pyrophosphatase
LLVAPAARKKLRTMKHDGGWRLRNSRYAFENRWYKVRQDELQLPTGELITYNVVEHPGYAMVVPLLDDGRVLLEHVYRYTVQETVIECPSGGLDKDTPEVAARRELEEETGWVAGKLDSLGSFFGSDGISNEVCHLFLATELQQTGRMHREPTEQIEIELMPFDRAIELATSGKIADAPSVLALLLAERKLNGR